MNELVDTLCVEIEQLALLLIDVTAGKPIANMQIVKKRAEQAQALAEKARKVCPRKPLYFY